MAPVLKVEATQAVDQGWAVEVAGSYGTCSWQACVWYYCLLSYCMWKDTRFFLHSLPFTPRATDNTKNLPSISMTILLLLYYYNYNAFMHIMELQGRFYWTAACWKTILLWSLTFLHILEHWHWPRLLRTIFVRMFIERIVFADIMSLFKRQVWLWSIMIKTVSLQDKGRQVYNYKKIQFP